MELDLTVAEIRFVKLLILNRSRGRIESGLDDQRQEESLEDQLLVKLQDALDTVVELNVPEGVEVYQPLRNC